MARTLTLALAALSWSLAGCGQAAPGAFDHLDGSPSDAAPHEASAGEAAPAGDDASSGLPEASLDDDADPGADGEAGTTASCVGLGAACKDGTTCLCGVGSACTFDNVACQAGVCVVAYPVVLDAGDPCCAGCQNAYDSCTPAGQACLSQWTTCNAACPEACPVLCLAAQGTPGG
jgi:hypothetical protein